MQNKIKNWEELCNDGENYGDEGKNLSPKEKILFESIKDKKVLKIQDAYLFSKTGKIEEDHCAGGDDGCRENRRRAGFGCAA